MPPIDPNAMQINEPPLTAAEYAIGDFIGETKIHGHTIHEHQNAWIVMLRRPNGAVINQQIFLRRQGYKFADAVAYAANENAKHNGGG